VASYYDGLNGNGQLAQYERSCPDGVTPLYWMSEDAISGSTWSYVEGMKYRSSVSILHNLIDRVSKNGNFLLNISPMADGTIPQEQKTILLEVGDWLRKYGESIYSTRAWEVYGEGPTNIMGRKKGTAFRAGTAQDIRFTRNKENSVLYAIILGWPGDGATVKIAMLNSKKFDATGLTKVTLLGETADSSIALSYAQDADGLNVTLPATKPHNAMAYVVKFSFSQAIRPLLSPAAP
jgi:alpha-L-fucosidase